MGNSWLTLTDTEGGAHAVEPNVTYGPENAIYCRFPNLTVPPFYIPPGRFVQAVTDEIGKPFSLGNHV